MNHFLFGVPRAAPWVPAEETDGMVITRMAVNGATVTLPTRGGGGPCPAPGGRGGRGGGGGGGLSINGTKSTGACITLASPILPKGTATLEVEWNHKVPGSSARLNHRMNQRWGDTLYQPTQWYPRVAVYDDLRGWDPELYLGPSEFYNNFGRFDVSIDVPGGWIVSGTGVLQNPEQVLTPTARARLSHVLEADTVITIVGANEVGPGKATAAGDRLVWHMVADTVNDFAWATAHKYVWTASRAVIPGKGPVPIHMVFLPGDANKYTKADSVARHALQFYSNLWFPYQFPKFTLQDGPSDGMEYPMVINANQSAADHETEHQWMPMTVSNNETWYGWMDEGFNQYVNILSDADAQRRPPNLNNRGQSYGRTAGNESEAPMMYNANFGGPEYSFMTYSKMPLVLSALGGVVGDTAVQRAQKEWARAWMFKHPSPWDYFYFMNNALHRDLGWFWYGWFFATESTDGSIQSVTTNGAKTTVLVHQAGQLPSPVILKVTFDSTGPAIKQMPNSVAADAMSTIVTYPVDVWFAGARTFTAQLDFGGRAIKQITLDPEGRFPDKDISDNVWPRGSGAAPAAGRGRRGGG